MCKAIHGAAYHLCGRLGLLEGFNQAERELLGLIKEGTTDAHLKEIVRFIDTQDEVGLSDSHNTVIFG